MRGAPSPEDLGFGVAVAVGVPATAFEADGGCGDDALQMARAMRADGDLGVGELLNFFNVLVAGGAFVLVERHDVSCLFFSADTSLLSGEV